VVDVTTPVSANWKVVVEAFLEVYHVQGIHPQLLPMLDDLATTFECFERHSRMVVPFGVPSMRLTDVPPQEVLEAFVRASGTGSTEGPRAATGLTVPEGTSARELLIERARRQGESRGHDYSGLSRDQLIDDWHYHLFPNLVFNAHAGAFLFFRIRPDVHSPDRCLFDLQTYAWPDEASRHEHEPMAHVEVPERSMSLGEVLDQDLENLPGVQEGLHSAALDHVTVSRQEIRIVHLHEVLERYLSA
jgi:choline monooxygenase